MRGAVSSKGPPLDDRWERAVLTLLLPVTRAWTLPAVIETLGASDVPRERCVLVLDAPGCEAWIDALTALGFDVDVTRTGNPDPPQGRIERRDRHRQMRRLTQTLVPDGPLLCLEDDILVPPDIYAKLSTLAPHATGVQMGRYKYRIPVIYPLRPRCGTGVEQVRGCGHGCLLTTCEAYRSAMIGDGAGAIDEMHTSQIRPLVVDWGCVCGHLTEAGVLWP